MTLVKTVVARPSDGEGDDESPETPLCRDAMDDELEEDVEELSESLSATAEERHRWRAFLGRLDPALLAPGTPLGPTPPLEAVRLGLDLVVLRLFGTAVLVASQTSSRSSRRLRRSSPSVEQSVSGSE